MELKDTAVMMQSEDYKERFRAEYWQAKIRTTRLHAMTVAYEAGKLEFKPNCPLGLLREQEAHMMGYLRTLEVRAQIENIEL